MPADFLIIIGDNPRHRRIKTRLFVNDIIPEKAVARWMIFQVFRRVGAREFFAAGLEARLYGRQRCLPLQHHNKKPRWREPAGLVKTKPDYFLRRNLSSVATVYACS
jgi:hypothetical protein